MFGGIGDREVACSGSWSPPVACCRGPTPHPAESGGADTATRVSRRLWSRTPARLRPTMRPSCASASSGGDAFLDDACRAGRLASTPLGKRSSHQRTRQRCQSAPSSLGARYSAIVVRRGARARTNLRTNLRTKRVANNSANQRANRSVLTDTHSSGDEKLSTARAWSKRCGRVTGATVCSQRDAS